ncbi:MAG: hypothetical protein H0T95_10810 [Chthoniobacterales bacterium]|nr:hypothetical protein [Chthoniobacterales bacterium]MBA3762785.1 hypothetical protein [Chthoniobacterales bacterium]
MNSYLLKLNEREDGPHPDTQIAQMFADQRVNRYTPCKPEAGGEWRTIDDYMPMLKYGTQLPPASLTKSAVAITPGLDGRGIVITDVDVPFGSVLKMAFKIFCAWLIVVVCFAPIAIILWFLILAGILSFFGSAFSGSHP